MNDLPFNYTDIEANFDKRDMQRGKGYWRDGAVGDLEISPDGMRLTAKVRGTQSRPYSVEVEVVRTAVRSKSGIQRLLFYANCSCPVGIDCKHAAAVCYAALESRKKQQQTIQKPIGLPFEITAEMLDEPIIQRLIAELPPHIQATIKRPQASIKQHAPEPWETWLDDLARTEDAAAKPARQKEVVLYILDVVKHEWRNPPLQLRIRPVISRILKEGGYSPTPRDSGFYQLATGRAQYLTPEDALIGKIAQESSYSYTTEFCSPPGDDDTLDLIMRRVIATGRGYLRDLTGAPLVLGEARPAKLGWRMEMDGSQVPAIIAHEDQSRLFILPAARPWYVDTATRETGPLEFGAPLSLVHKFLAGPKLLPNAIASVAERMAAKALPGNIVAPRALKVEQKKTMPPVPCLRLTSHITSVNYSTDGGDNDRVNHLALLHFDYDGMEIDPNGAPDILRRQIDDRIIVMSRDTKSEAKFIDRIGENKGLTATYVRPPDAPKSRLSYAFAQGPSERMQWLDFIHREVPELIAGGWRVTIDDGFGERFKTVEVDSGEDTWEADLKEQQGGSWWFSLDLGIMVDGQRVPLLPLLVQALKRLPEPTTAAIEGLALSGKLYVDLPDGRALALPFERVRDILTTLVELYDQPLNPDGTMTVPLDLATALSRIDSATKMRWLGGERLRALIERLKNFSGLTQIPPPEGLTATLRPYQREGVNWLQFLRDYGLGGILADDMGLGKTIQTLAHILVEKNAGRLDKPCLIVCPTSLIPNWQDEAEKFAPKLKVLSLHGKDRAARYGDIEKSDLVLTTYPLLPRDSEILLPIEWHIVVLDEAQAIKNPTTKATQLVCELNTRNRLCLTGTPIENHLGEAWSHFAFLMPGMLGTHKDFTKRFRTPIEKQKDVDRQALLARRLKPFVLRRNKSEVAKELPPKTEIIHHVEFDSAQRDLYETVRLTMHEKVQQAVSEKGFNRSHIVILDALLKLRQACCDPRLVKLSGAKKVKQSAKLDSLMEMLPEMIEEGRRILLFSQFTSMLDLIKPELDKLNIPFVEIRGDTTDRKTPVTRFQNCEVPLFLISLKAGGTGLNLTAADTVIHYDPWWNPAVENQATDRAHRIGQDKPVFVYKFIAKGTVEERILDLQNRKRGLASALLEERPDATAAFAADDLDFLFQEAE